VLKYCNDYEPRNHWEYAGEAIIDPNGFFTCRYLRAGQYYLCLRTDQGTMGISDIFELGESEHLENFEFNFGRGRIRLSIVDLETADGIPNASFVIKNDLGAYICGMDTNEEGLAERMDLPKGRYIVAVQTPGYLAAESEWLDVDDAVDTPATVYLERAASITFELATDIRRKITAEMAYVRFRATNLENQQVLPNPTLTSNSPREDDEYTIFLLPARMSKRQPPAIDLPEGRYEIRYRLYQDPMGHVSYTVAAPILEGAEMVNLSKGRMTTITISGK
jgi:hypothetical protein